MTEKMNPRLVQWRTRLLVAAIIISALWLIAVFGPKSMVPEQKLSIGISLIPLLLVWGTVLFVALGLRAWSCILASLESMFYAVSGGLILLTPGPLRLFGVVPLLLAIFFFIFSTKTWTLHEGFWLEQSVLKAGTGPSN
jgi:hypothetical protein